ncbi:chalcone isomerase family protein [Marinicella sp. W31]|uniref:chalcone isomerase family protein n=1 Tax=Marinicella sp. W31 TaxID=3023713 RepID=UPI003757B224
MRHLLIFICLLSAGFQAQAKTLSSTIEHNQESYTLCSDFTIKYGFIFKVAHVGLYLPDCSSTLNPLEQPKKILRFKYLVDISSEDFQSSAEEFYLKNVNTDVLEASKDEFYRFNAGYQDIESGEFYDLIHQGDSKLSLYKNNASICATENSVLAKNYFTIWFGQKPVLKKMKKALTQIKT